MKTGKALNNATEDTIVYAVYATNYSGETDIAVFLDERKAYRNMIQEMERVMEDLKEQGYTYESAENEESCEIWIADHNISYQWDVYECLLS